MSKKQDERIPHMIANAEQMREDEFRLQVHTYLKAGLQAGTMDRIIDETNRMPSVKDYWRACVLHFCAISHKRKREILLEESQRLKKERAKEKKK